MSSGPLQRFSLPLNYKTSLVVYYGIILGTLSYNLADIFLAWYSTSVVVERILGFAAVWSSIATGTTETSFPTKMASFDIKVIILTTDYATYQHIKSLLFFVWLRRNVWNLKELNNSVSLVRLSQTLWTTLIDLHARNIHAMCHQNWPMRRYSWNKLLTSNRKMLETGLY